MVKGSLPDPEATFASELKKELQKNGIDIREVRSARSMSSNIDESKLVKLLTLEGHSIKEIITATNHRSINLFAEQLVCLSEFEKKKSSTIPSAKDFINEYWNTKLSGFSSEITDGSGLSRSNLINCNDLVSLLAFISTTENATNFKNSLPLSGDSGTLSSYSKNSISKERIRAKSGTMHAIKSYSGYVTTVDNNELAFAIIINGHDCSSSQMKAIIQELFDLMAKL